MPVQRDFQQRLKSIEQILGNIRAAADPSLRTSVEELVQLVMDLHGAGLERILELIRGPGDAGETLVQKLGRDDLVSSLLVLYGLHPVSMETRLTQALEKVATRLRAHNAEVELLSMSGGIVRLRLRANGHGHGSNGPALKEMIENAIYQATPDIVSLDIEGGEDKQGFVPLEMLQAALAPPPPRNGFAFATEEKGTL